MFYLYLPYFLKMPEKKFRPSEEGRRVLTISEVGKSTVKKGLVEQKKGDFDKKQKSSIADQCGIDRGLHDVPNN